MNDSILWFITISEKGDGQPDGFYCPPCFNCKIEKSSEALTFKAISPDNTPKYTCDICGKDYRDL